MQIANRLIPTSRPVARSQTRAARTEQPADRVTLTGRLARVARNTALGGVLGAAATGIGLAGALAGGYGPLIGIAGSTALGITMAHKLKMEVPSTYSAPEQAGLERTFYGALAGFMGGAFGATVGGLGVITGAPAVAIGSLTMGYGAALAGTRNAILTAFEPDCR